jgi:hypothetical protein
LLSLTYRERERERERFERNVAAADQPVAGRRGGTYIHTYINP